MKTVMNKKTSLALALAIIFSGCSNPRQHTKPFEFEAPIVVAHFMYGNNAVAELRAKAYIPESPDVNGSSMAGWVSYWYKPEFIVSSNEILKPITEGDHFRISEDTKRGASDFIRIENKNGFLNINDLVLCPPIKSPKITQCASLRGFSLTTKYRYGKDATSTSYSLLDMVKKGHTDGRVIIDKTNYEKTIKYWGEKRLEAKIKEEKEYNDRENSLKIARAKMAKEQALVDNFVKKSRINTTIHCTAEGHAMSLWCSAPRVGRFHIDLTDMINSGWVVMTQSSAPYTTWANQIAYEYQYVLQKHK